MMAAPQKALVIFMDETDMWHDERLYAAIVRVLERQGLAGATAMAGLMGYGIHRRIHRKGLFGVSDDKPVTIIAVDTEDKIRAVLPAIVPTCVFHPRLNFRVLKLIPALRAWQATYSCPFRITWAGNGGCR